MDFEINVRKIANDKYGDNILIKNRIDKELSYFRENNLLSEIEFISYLKENLDQNILIDDFPFLSFYLTGLSLINPLPAHFYSEKTKEVRFVSHKKYGIDLDQKDGFKACGFGINPNLIFQSDIYFEIKIDKKYKKQVENDIYKYFGENTIITEDRNEWRDKISYKSTNILFLEILNDLYYEENIYQYLQIKDFKKYIFGIFINEKLDLTNVNPNKASEFIINYDFKNQIKSFDDFLYLFGLSKTYINPFVLYIDIYEKIYPSNREEIFNYYASHGFDCKNSAKYTDAISFKIEISLPPIDDKVDSYLKQTLYTRPKASLIKVLIYSYLDYKINALIWYNIFRRTYGKFEIKYFIYTRNS